MHSAASFSPSPQAQMYSTSWKLPPKSTPSPTKAFTSSAAQIPTLFKPSLSSTPFPLNLKSTSYPIQLHPLADSVHDNLVENIENSHIPINEIRKVTPSESCPRIFIQDPPWIASLFLKGMYKKSNQEVRLEFKEMEKRKYNLPRRSQIKAETEAWEKMVEECRELQREMCEKKLTPNLPYLKAYFFGWFKPMRDVIEREQNVQRTKKQKAAFANVVSRFLKC